MPTRLDDDREVEFVYDFKTGRLLLLDPATDRDIHSGRRRPPKPTDSDVLTQLADDLGRRLTREEEAQLRSFLPILRHRIDPDPEPERIR